MKQLEELEKKVLQIISRNKELTSMNIELKSENKNLYEQVQQLEASLMNQNDSSKCLVQETANVKASIEELLDNINSLENIK